MIKFRLELHLGVHIKIIDFVLFLLRTNSYAKMLNPPVPFSLKFPLVLVSIFIYSRPIRGSVNMIVLI